VITIEKREALQATCYRLLLRQLLSNECKDFWYMVKSAPDRGSECLEFVHQLSPALSARFSKNEPGSLPICRGIFEIV